MSTDVFLNNLDFFRKLISCGHSIYSWTYNDLIEPVFSNCPEELVFHLLFSQEPHIHETIKNLESYDQPVVLSHSLGLMWIADFEQDSTGKMVCIHVIGPVFYDDISPALLEKELERLNLSMPIRHQVMDVLDLLPILPTTRFLEYGLMLHYTLTGQKINRSDFLYPKEFTLKTHCTTSSTSDFHGTWAAEQAILKLVEEGNLDHKKRRERLPATGQVGKMSNGDPIRQIKNQLIVFTALCTRAAIRGGSPSGNSLYC